MLDVAINRITDRAELSDILSQMVGELSALHIFVRGGDTLRGTDQVQPGSLGATFARVQKELGDKVDRDVRFISISVDPATDTPERLKA